MGHVLFLFLQLVRRDVAARYKGSLLGRFWSLISPLLLLAVYTFVFSVVFQARWGEINQGKADFALNLFAGMILHGFLAECMSRNTTVLQQNENYIKRVVFPLRILPVVITGAALFHALTSLLILLLAIFFIKGGLHWQIFYLPLTLLPLVIFAAGISLAFAALGLFIRDLAQLMPMLTTVLLFTAPVFYPTTALPEAYRSWLELNPLTNPIEMLRGLLFNGQLPTLETQWSAWAIALLILAFGNFIFQRLRKGFADAI